MLGVIPLALVFPSNTTIHDGGGTIKIKWAGRAISKGVNNNEVSIKSDRAYSLSCASTSGISEKVCFRSHRRWLDPMTAGSPESEKARFRSAMG